MKNKIAIVFTILWMSLAFLWSCQNSKKTKCEELLRDMRSTPILLPLDSMIYVGTNNNSIIRNNLYRIVVYNDSRECSECSWKHMYMWNDYVKLCNEQNYDVGFIFIIRVDNYSKDNVKLRGVMKNIAFKSSYYIDTLGVFERVNKHIPQSDIYHTFLLDNDNNVILVGNPIKYPNIDNLYLHYLSELHK